METMYRLRSKAPWGDFGDILCSGFPEGRDTDGRMLLQRVGPFVPPISFPGGMGWVVTDSVRQGLETSAFRGIEFREVVKHKIVRHNWHLWDRSSDLTPKQLPESEPEDYILSGNHCAETAAELPALWELIPTSARLELLDLDVDHFAVDGRTAAHAGSDFHPVRRTSLFVTEAVRQLLLLLANEWIDFEAIPVVTSSDEYFRLVLSIDNLKRLGLAAKLYASDNYEFPESAVFSSDDQPLLSWRVQLLPYLGFNAQYEQFHLDEPWDSPHNLALLKPTPRVYRSPHLTSNQIADGMTAIVAPMCSGGVIANPGGTRTRDITDGTAYTLLFVEASANNAVPWTKPDDLHVVPSHLGAAFVGLPNDYFRGVLCDGHVRRFPHDAHNESLLKLFVMNDGQVIRDDDFGTPDTTDIKQTG